jgi:uncharacterized repeat protein (TIGR03803 family)
MNKSFSLIAAMIILASALGPCTALAQSFESIVTLGSKGGETPLSDLIEGSDGFIYGTTSRGGTAGKGVVFRMSPSGAMTKLVDFSGTSGTQLGATPRGALAEAPGRVFWGTTSEGGSADLGTIYRVDAEGNFANVVSFTGNGASYKGATPCSTLAPAADGSFYGTTSKGGVGDHGTIFKVSPSGLFTTLVEFTGNGASNRGSQPLAGLLLSSDGNFYGTTSSGGVNNLGTVFKLTSAGVLSTLWDFSSATGSSPRAALIEGTDGNLYGTTFGSGSVFRISHAGSFATLCTMGASSGKLIQVTSGELYGTTKSGSFGGNGEVFRVTLGGVYTSVRPFGRSEFGYGLGADPAAGLLQMSNGSILGSTEYTDYIRVPGAPSYSPVAGGTIFRLGDNPNTPLVDFSTVNALPDTLVPGNDGNLYGYTSANYGRVLRVTPAGNVTSIANLNMPFGFIASGITKGSDGNFYIHSRIGGGGEPFDAETTYKVHRVESFRLSPPG